MKAKKNIVREDIFISKKEVDEVDEDDSGIKEIDTIVDLSITSPEDKNKFKVQKGTRHLEMKKDFKKDCKGSEYIPDTLEPTTRTIAIGDIHGDIDVAINMLRIARCIKKVPSDTLDSVLLKNKKNQDEYYIWTGKDTQVVQVGDQVDRCRPIGDNICLLPNTTSNDEASDIKILKFYTEMNKMARKKGGRLVSLLGNHELMNVAGKMHYVSYMGLLDFSPNVDLSKMTINSSNNNDFSKFTEEGLQYRRNAFTNKNNIERKEPLNEYLACTRTSAIIIGDLLFVHGGFTKLMAESYDIDNLNKIVRKWLLGKLTDEVENENIDLLKTKPEHSMKNVSYNFKERLNKLLNSGSKGMSIFWNRLLGQLPSDIDIKNKNIKMSDESKKNIIEKCDAYLKPVFKILNINGIIVGHTPQMNKEYGINSTCGQRAWRIDIGASGAFDAFRNEEDGNKREEVLEITYKNNKTLFNILDKSNIAD